MKNFIITKNIKEIIIQKLTRLLQFILIKAKIIKCETPLKLDKDGLYETKGLNKKNPLSYLVLIIVLFISFIIYFIEGLITLSKKSVEEIIALSKDILE